MRSKKQDKIKTFVEYIKKENKQVHGLMIMKKGEIIENIGFKGYSNNEKHPIYSCSKSITSILIGKAIQDGFIDGVDQKVLAFFPEIIISKENKEIEDMTIEDLLTMSTGLEWDDRKNYDEMWDSKNSVEYFFNRKMVSAPGTRFNYCSGVVHILQFILENVTGQDTLSYGKKVLFDPLGISDIFWERYENDFYGSIEISSLDMCRIGKLLLNEGIWDGNEIVSKQWIDISTAKHIDTPDNMNEVTNFGAGYGYLWWGNRFGGFHANGFGGQYMFVIPDEDMIVVFTGELFGADFFIPQLAMEKYII